MSRRAAHQRDTTDAHVSGNETDRSPKIAIALSGGGYRAAAFGLGVLLYVYDSQGPESITSVSSVSGGSITNAFAAARLGDPSAIENKAEYWRRAQYLASSLAHRSLLSLGLLDLIPLLIVAGVAFGVWYVGLGLVAVAATAMALVGVTVALSYLRLRSLMSMNLEKILTENEKSPSEQQSLPQRIVLVYFYALTFRPGRALGALRGHSTPLLGSLRPCYCPIFCTTDLASGTHLFLSNKFVAGVRPETGATKDHAPADLVGAAPTISLAEVVAASAAFPGVFQPARIKSEQLGLPTRSGLVPRTMTLADGGLHDNLGFSFYRSWTARSSAGGASEFHPALHRDLPDEPTQYIVVNSGLRDYKFTRGVIGGLWRSIDVIHQANSSARREEVRGFLSRDETRGVLVSIGDNPYLVAEPTGRSNPKSAAIEALDRLEREDGSITSAWWQSVAQELNPGVRTNLRGLGSTVAARLIMHGYMATMAHTTTELGWPIPMSCPTAAEFHDLCRSKRSLTELVYG